MQTDATPILDFLLRKLRDVEIAAGNLMEVTESHRVRDLKDLGAFLQSHTDEVSSGPISDQTADDVFKQIVGVLTAAGRSTFEITDIVNTALQPYSTLPYCNEQEVKEALP